MVKQRNRHNRKKGDKLRRQKGRNIVYKKKISGIRNINKKYKRNQYLWRIVSNYKDIIVFLFFLTLGLSIYFYMAHLLESKANSSNRSNHVKEIVERIKKEYPLGLWNKYPGGYRIVIMSNRYIIPTDVNTLPVGLDIDWKNTHMLRIPPEMKKKNPYLTKVEIYGISYPECNINEISVSEIFPKIKGTKINLISLCERQFVMEILEAYEDYIVCVFGVK